MGIPWHPFGPDCPQAYAGQTEAPDGQPNADVRSLFYGLLHVTEYQSVHRAAYRHLRQALVMARPVLTSDQPSGCELRQLAPVLLTEPAWLDTAVQTATSDTPLAAGLLPVWQALAYAPGNPLQHCRTAIAALNPALPGLATWGFAQQSDIPSACFDFAAVQLALGQFPRSFFPELLGFTLAFCSMESDPLPDSAFAATRRQCALQQLPAVEAVAAAYLDLFAGQAEILRQRIDQGQALYRYGINACIKATYAQPVLSPHQAFMRLLRDKAPFAHGHHQRIQVQGRSLDDWFGSTPFDAERFWETFRQSPYIDRDNPECSRLLQLFAPGGPMYGVLEGDERQLLAEALADPSSTGDGQQTPNNQDGRAGETSAILSEPAAAKPMRLGKRQLFHRLLNAEFYPDTHAAALQRANSVLRWSARLHRPPFMEYQHQRFEAHLQALYAREMRHYRPPQRAPRLSKATYRWAIYQFAPAILTDGCWLEHCGSLARFSNHALGKVLQRIFSDEVGGGLLEQNHPLIYRRLLQSLGYELPPTHTLAFAEHPGFLERAFDLPTYLMSIARFPSRFLPELLGLNLAIELSGLGRFYLRLSDALKHWGIDTEIVQVHITADNFASGHAAMAKRAVQAHLDEILATQGEAEMQRHWRRVDIGYASLAIATSPFIASLVGSYCWRRISRFVGGHTDD